MSARATVGRCHEEHPPHIPARNGLLCLPGVIVLSGGWWLSARRSGSPKDNKPHLTLHIEKPTTLEAFQGNDVALVVEVRHNNPRKGQFYGFSEVAPYLQVVTPLGTQTSLLGGESSRRWGDIWGGNVNNSRFLFKLKKVPQGRLFFGIGGTTQWGGAPVSPPVKPLHMTGKWEVKRAQIQPVTIAALPRYPRISLSDSTLNVVRVKSGVIGGVVSFRLDGEAMDEATPVEISFSNSQGSSTGTDYLPNKGVRSRIYGWTAYLSYPLGSLLRPPSKLQGASALLDAGRSAFRASLSTGRKPRSARSYDLRPSPCRFPRWPRQNEAVVPFLDGSFAGRFAVLS